MMDSAPEQTLGRRKKPAAIGGDRHLVSRAAGEAGCAVAQHHRGRPRDAAVGSRVERELAVRALLDAASPTTAPSSRFAKASVTHQCDVVVAATTPAMGTVITEPMITASATRARAFTTVILAARLPARGAGLLFSHGGAQKRPTRGCFAEEKGRIARAIESVRKLAQLPTVRIRCFMNVVLDC